MDDMSMMVREERDFLHSLATPLGSAVLIADCLLEDFEKGTPRPSSAEQVKYLVEVLSQMNVLLENRKNSLLERSQKE